MKLIWVFILLNNFPLIVWAWEQHSNIFSGFLASTFNYDFTHIPRIGEAIVWQMSENEQTFEPHIYVQNNIPKFESNKTYLLLTQSSYQICIYYWVGSVTPLEFKKSTAKYALLQYLQFYNPDDIVEKVSITREEEFIESESFHNTVNFIDKPSVTEDMYIYHGYVDVHFPSKLPNLYIVRGQSTIRIKAVPMGTKWFINDSCLILETGYKVNELPPVNIYCGANANDKVVAAAEHIARSFRHEYESVWQNPLKRSDPLFKAFVETLENNDYYKLQQEDNSNDHLKDTVSFVADRDRNVSFYNIYRKERIEMCATPDEVFLALYSNREVFGKYGSYLFDSASIAGIFFHIDSRADIWEKLMGLENAEEYLYYKYSLASKPTRMRIIEFRETRYLLQMDFTINLIDYLLNQEMMDNINLPREN